MRTTREELLTLLKELLPPAEHWDYCQFCGDCDRHRAGCTFVYARTICAAHEAGELEFEDDAKEPTRPGQRVKCVHAKDGVFALGDEFVVAYVCGGDVQFEGSGDWWPCWWFEVIGGKDGAE